MWGVAAARSSWAASLSGLSRKRIVWVSGIKKAGSTDSEKSFNLTHCFGDHVVRLAGQKLVL
jgi:hypothetical protein